MTFPRYLALKTGLLDHLRDGLLNSRDLAVFITLLMLAKVTRHGRDSGCRSTSTRERALRWAI